MRHWMMEVADALEVCSRCGGEIEAGSRMGRTASGATFHPTGECRVKGVSVTETERREGSQQ